MICFAKPEVQFLDELLQEHYTRDKKNEPGTVKQKQYSIDRFHEFAGRKIPIELIKKDLFNSWLASMEREGLAPSTVHGNRKNVLALLNYAYNEEFVDEKLRRIRSIEIPWVAPKAWRPAEVRRIISKCPRNARGRILAATLWLCWDTDCRISAVYGAKPAQLDRKQKLVRIYDPKTKAMRPYELCDECLAALDRLPKNRERLCGANVRIQQLRKWLTKTLIAAGFEHDRLSKFHKIRRSKYTDVARIGGILAAAKHAGHRSTAMARRYLDDSIIDEDMAIVRKSVLPKSDAKPKRKPATKRRRA